jgi:hypothetical protein
MRAVLLSVVDKVAAGGDVASAGCGVSYALSVSQRHLWSHRIAEGQYMIAEVVYRQILKVVASSL